MSELYACMDFNFYSVLGLKLILSRTDANTADEGKRLEVRFSSALATSAFKLEP